MLIASKKLVKTAKVFSFVLCIALLFSVLSTPVFATQTRTYNSGRLNQLSTYDGFWLRGTLPTLNPNWTSGTENKINYEFWFNINNSSSAWVEMGYHKGYDWNTDGSANTSSSYNGCFTAKATSSSWDLVKLSSLNWNAGQSHTMGVELYSSYFCDIRSDGTAWLSWINTTTSNTGSIDAGLEWGVSNGASQSISLPSSMTDLNTRVSGTWKTWSSIGGVYTSNSHSGVTATFDSANNKINFN